MSLFVLGDVHLSLSADKPMEVFYGWQDHLHRLESHWRAVVSPQDTVVLNGDISWAMRLEEMKADLDFLENLPGQKIIAKGNHDLWWETMKKMTAFVEQNGWQTLHFLFNNSYAAGPVSVCGTRGWMEEEGEDQKILLREAARLARSLESAKESGREPVAFLHYPPVTRDGETKELTAVLKEYGVTRCYYGHLHGPSIPAAFQGERDGIRYYLTSCDSVDFCPVLIEKY